MASRTGQRSGNGRGATPSNEIIINVAAGETRLRPRFDVNARGGFCPLTQSALELDPQVVLAKLAGDVELFWTAPLGGMAAVIVGVALAP